VVGDREPGEEVDGRFPLKRRLGLSAIRLESGRECRNDAKGSPSMNEPWDRSPKRSPHDSWPSGPSFDLLLKWSRLVSLMDSRSCWTSNRRLVSASASGWTRTAQEGRI